MIPFVLLIASAFTRLLFFGHPSSVVFDEVHIGNYVTNYWHGTFFFDVHPPLAKLLIAGLGYLTGANNQTIDWATIGNQMTVTIINLRLLPLVLGIVLPIIVYHICRRLNLSKTVSSVAGLLIILENSLLVESRFLFPDMFLIFFGFSSLLLYLSSRQTLNDWHGPNRWRGLTLLTLSMLSAALATGVKWTGLAFPLLIVLFETYRLFSEKKPTLFKIAKQIIGLGGAYLAVCMAVYVSLFAIHFSSLPQSGSGNAFMSPSFQKTLKGNPFSNDGAVKPEGFLGKMTELNTRMFDASASLTKSHGYSSKWYSWPLMIRPIFYWQGIYNAETKTNSYIYYIGNPIIYWFGAATVIALLICSMSFYVRRLQNKPALFFILVGYAVNFLPFIFIGRVMFLYHYEAALIFSIITIAYLLDTLSASRKKTITVALVFLAFASFIFFSPLTYGTALSDDALHARMWLSTWR